VETRGQSRPIVTPLRGDIRLAVSAILIKPREIYRNALAHRAMRGRESVTAVTERRKKSERVRFCWLRIAVKPASWPSSSSSSEDWHWTNSSTARHPDLRVSKSSSPRLRGDMAVRYALTLFSELSICIWIRRCDIRERTLLGFRADAPERTITRRLLGDPRGLTSFPDEAS